MIENTIADSKKSIIYILQSVVCGVCPLLLIPIITDKLDPVIFGNYSLVVVYASIVIGIANFGCIAGYERNFFLSENSNKQSGQLLCSVQVFIGFSFSIVIFLGWCFSEKIVTVILSNSQYTKLWLVVLIALSLSSFLQYYLTYLKNKGLAYGFCIITALQTGINFGISIGLLIYTDHGIMSLAYALLISNALMVVISLIHQLFRLPFLFSSGYLMDVLKVSLPLTPKVLFGFLNTQFDKILLGHLAESGNVGIYTIAQKISMSIYLFMTALDRVFKPNIFRMLFSVSSSKKIGKYLTSFVFISLFPALIIVLFSSEIVTLFLSEKYSGATGIIIVLSIYYAGLFIGKINGAQLVYAEKTWFLSKWTLISGIVNIILNLPFIYFWGAIGAALATTLSSIIMTYICNIYSQKFAKITWELKKVQGMYFILLISSLFVIGIDSEMLNLNYNLILVLKGLIIGLYMYLGYQSGIINRSIINKLLIKVNTI